MLSESLEMAVPGRIPEALFLKNGRFDIGSEDHTRLVSPTGRPREPSVVFGAYVESTVL